MSDDPRMADVQRRLLRPSSVEDVRGTLAVLDDLSAVSESEKAAKDGLRRAFECLRELTGAEHDQAVEVLIGDLLPRCLAPDAPDDRWYGPRLCHTFGDWLDDLPEEHRHRVRVVALPRAIAALGGDAIRNTIRLISCIGYSEDGVLDALDRIARGRDDETGDHALSARVALRSKLEPSVRSWYLGKLHGRIPAGPNIHQLTCGRLIGTRDTAELVWSSWLAPTTAQGPEQNLLASFARSLLAEIAERERDSGFTERVWNWLVELSRRTANGIDEVFGPNSSLVNRLDLPAVVPELVRLAIRAEGNHRYIYYLRLLECDRPTHMAGWDAIASSDLEIVRADAVAPTRTKGRFSTSEVRRKEAAWDMLLCCGVASALPPFGDVLVEENGYVSHRFLELAECLRLDPLPGVVEALLAGSAAAEWDKDERLVAQIGAIGAAHAAGTRDAFNALLGYRQLGDGVLLSLIEALAETALTLLESGDRSAVEHLLLTAETSPQQDSRGAAAGAVAALLEDGALTEPESARAASLLTLPTTDPYARRELLFALASRPPAEVSPIAVEYANGVLSSVATDGPDARPAALTLLGRLPGSRLDPDFLSRHLGLMDPVGTPVTSQSSFKGVAPHVLGRYFVVEPLKFAPAVASLLRDGDAGALANVLPSVREVGAKNPVVVLDALVARLRRADSGWVAEPPVLQTLAEVAPDRLVADGCPNVAAWLPQARADLAEALGRLGSLTEGLSHARFEVLTRLAGDGIYAVRRAAYRAAAGFDEDRFAALALSWAQWREPGRQGPRRYAAECAGWFSPTVAEEHFAPLGWDQEPAVREAYARSLRERDDRLAAREFEVQVLEVRDPAGVVRNWRHGIGLSRVGDDSTIRRLADRLGDGLPPSVRYWLTRVRKAVEKRWSEVTRKWPEPWYARPGNLERFSGVFKGEDGQETGLAGTLWLMPAESLGGLSSWGGWATSQMPWRGDDGVLLIPNRSAARLLVSSAIFPTCELVFWGNGPYPPPVP